MTTHKYKPVFTAKRLFFSPAVTDNFTSIDNSKLNLNFTSIDNSKLNLILEPWWITGFTDGEGCFSISIRRNKTCKLDWEIKLSFSFSLHKKDKALLENVQSYFGVGSINTKHGPQTIKYYVQSIKDLAIIIDHFERCPLITQKRADYELFKQVFYLILKKEHLTLSGLHKIVAIKASINKGLSSELKVAFPLITPVQRPKVEEILIHDPYWFLGFVEAEGCFSIMILKSQTIKTGFSVSLRFQLTQHSRDIVLMQNLRNFWDCGNIIEDSKQPIVDFKINKFSDIHDKVIPFFQKYPIQGG
jgi:hypothetical protein